MRGIVVIAALAACVMVGVPAGASADPSAQIAKACAPPRGPADKRVHSTNLRVRYIRCATGRKVARTCVYFTYGRSGRCKAAGRRWRCTSRRVGKHKSTQRCVSGRRVMSIRWVN